MIDLKQLMIDSRKIAIGHGFHTGWDNFAEKLALLHSEVSEVLEEFRKGHRAEIYYVNGKPEGIPIELADLQIRLAELVETLDIPLEDAIHIKQAYNESRPFKHGKAF